MSRIRPIFLLAAAAAVSACGDDGAGPSAAGVFGPVQSVLASNDCRNCHNANNSVYHGNFELANDRAADSAAVVLLLDFESPTSSPVVQRNLMGSSLTHPVRPFASTADDDAVTLLTFAQTLATAGASRVLEAAKVSAAPTVDGVVDAAWVGLTGIGIPISGGFAGSTTVTMKAMYIPGDRVFFLLQWDDPTESVHRSPWLRTVSGWLRQPVAPPLFQTGVLANWRTRPDVYNYEDKAAIIWNTTGASAVEGFDESGCAVLCHVNRPGDSRPLKYTNRNGQTADMWHWKLVRTNVVHRLDDQYVYWNRDLAVNSNGGRAGDPGGGEYKSNGSTAPAFVSASQPAAPFWMVDSATAVAWAGAGLTIDPGDIARAATAADTFAVGDEVANAITTLKPNVDRSHIEAYGVWSNGRWTLEIARLLQTNSTGAIPAGGTATVPVDVQFTPGQTYTFGVAVFENAQIEHSWSPGVYRLRFQP